VPVATAQTVDYHKADLIRTASTYMFSGDVFPAWLEDSVRFWYRSPGRADRGVVYVVDPRTAAKRVLFDNARLAAALSVAADTLFDPARIPTFRVTDTARTIEFPMLRKKAFRCQVATYRCVAVDSADFAYEQALKNGPTWASRSPDKQWDVFWYNRNLYARPAAASDADAAATRDSVKRARADTTKRDPKATPPKVDSLPLPSGAIPLTTDGTRLFEYGVSNRSLADTLVLRKPSRPIVVWSPDSRKFSVRRTDNRGVRVYPIYSSTTDQPTDKSFIYAAASDSVVPMFDVHIIDLAARTNVKVDQPRSPEINFSASETWALGSDRLYLVNAGRTYKRMTILNTDARTGATSPVMRDSTDSWSDFGLVYGGTFRVVNGDDIFWLSERDGFGHLYRYAPDGTLKNQVTAGPYMVRSLNFVDSTARRLYVTASGKEPGNPYFAYLYRVNFDGTGMTLLTPEPGAHRVTFVPKAPYFIDNYSRVDMPPVTVLRDLATGRVLMELGRADVEYLRAIGWTPPEVITMKARDGVTDIYGLMYKPSNFDSTKSYPIIDHIYPGPFTGSTSVNYAFVGTSEPRALAELGFIVVQIDHMGSPWRSKSFTDYYLNNMIDNGIPDHVAGIRQLAARYSWIDINRVGIYGHSGGGYASTDAMFTYPNFYKVAVSGAGNHHPNTYGHFWAERYLGPYDKAKYDRSANYTYARNLKGKLLLMHGDMDTNVHPANTLKVVDALIKANKTFDMIIYPDAGHGLPDHSIRMRWDYFVRHLMGGTPPADYEMMATPRPF